MLVFLFVFILDVIFSKPTRGSLIGLDDDSTFAFEFASSSFFLPNFRASVHFIFDSCALKKQSRPRNIIPSQMFGSLLEFIKLDLSFDVYKYLGFIFLRIVSG